MFKMYCSLALSLSTQDLSRSRHFYRATLYALHGIYDSNAVCLSVRLSVSVWLSVTLVDCVHMFRPTIMISSPYGSPIILVSGDIKLIPKFEGDHPERGRWMRVGWVRIGDFRPISRRISETVRDTILLITYRKSYTLFRLVPKSTTLVDPEMTLAAIMHSVAFTHVFRSKPLKFAMKIDPYYQRQQCSPGILVSSKVRFMGIFAGVRWRGGVKWDWGVKNGDFRFFRSLYLPNLHI